MDIFPKYPFHTPHFQNKQKPPISNLIKMLFLIQLLIFLANSPVKGLSWDGVIVTQADFQALQAFKHELIDPRGFLKSWNDSGFGACSGQWEGIKCAKGQVIVIQLPWRGLSGKLTEKIGQFQALRKLSLHDNLIGGQIPISLGFLKSLRGVQLFNNRFAGSIPASIASCPILQTLDFSNNSLSGPIPFGIANSTRLYRLNLSFNSLSGPIPSGLTRSYSIVFIDIRRNNISSVVPSFGNASRLEEIYLGSNRISGTIPNEMGSLSKLRILDFSNNFFNGSLPTTLSRLPSLSVLNLRGNRLTDRISDSIGNISTLTQLDLAQNNLSGEIPISLGELPNLVSFNVSYNNLSGPVPFHLSQKFDPSAFVGNLKLCGYSPSTLCPSIAPVPSPQISKNKKHKLNTKDIILIAAGALLVILLSLCCILLCCLIKKKSVAKKGEKGVAGPAAATSVAKGGSEAEASETGGKLVHFDGPMAFTADDLLCATAEIMGKSTYGTVYKATLEDGNQVAVKRLREKITKGVKEFETEVNVLGKIRHPNLLAMRAYYMGPKGEKLLVFDYMPKGSLASFLHARGPDTPIDWPTRMNIAKGISRGLLFLHNHVNIVHGNLTSSNVLLSDNTDAMIGDFGLSRLMTAAANANVVATAAALGYRAPELSKLRRATAKTDVYSLGVIILELLTGKSPGEATDGVDLPRWVASIVNEEWTNEVFDLELMREAPVIGDELLNTLKLGLHCVDPSPSARPDVQQVFQQLEEIRPENIAAIEGDEAGPSTVAE